MQFTIVQGDIIRSYDFKPSVGREDCFIEGEVIDPHSTDLGYQAYKIRVTKDHFGDNAVSVTAGPDNRVGHEIYVPWRTDRDYQGRIINLTR